MRVAGCVLLAALPLLANAAPLQEATNGFKISLRKRGLANDDGSVNATLLKGQLVHTTSKILNGLKTFEINTGRPLASLGINPDVNSAKRATSVDPLTDDFSGSLWHGGISVGTPAVTYTVDFDTGSSDLFLPGPQCTENCARHKVYNPSASSTSQDRQKTFSLQYGDGSSVSGEQYSDTVSIAGLTAKNQALGAAKTYSSGFAASEFPPDGLMGMAFPSLSAYNSNPPFQSFMAQGQLDEPVFAFKLTAKDSELFLGGTNPDLYQGDFTYLPVIEQGYWQVDVDSVGVNGNQAIGHLSSIVDTGTTLVVGDTQSVAQLYKSIPGSKDASNIVAQGFYTVPCNAIPTVSLTLGGRSFDIDPSIFNLGPVSQGSNDCIGGIAASDSFKFWIVGDVFLQNVYTVFDAGQGRVGFASLA